MMYSCHSLYPLESSELLETDNGSSCSPLNSWLGSQVILEVMSHGVLL